MTIQSIKGELNKDMENLEIKRYGNLGNKKSL
jgi:hypothetical protein